MKPIGPVDMKILLIIILVWLNITTFFITGLCLRIGEIEHKLVHVTCESQKH